LEEDFRKLFSCLNPDFHIILYSSGWQEIKFTGYEVDVNQIKKQKRLGKSVSGNRRLYRPDALLPIDGQD
jgi:hypothetical protein